MTTENEELAFDSDGIPILTDLVHEDDERRQPPANRQPERSTGELALELLESDAFREQLDTLATGLARDVRQQLEQALRPVIDVAISHALESGDNTSREAIRLQLEAALPELLAQAQQK
jgi:hypothetical protein